MWYNLEMDFHKIFLFVGWNTLAFVRNERNSRSSRRTRRELYQFSCIDRPNGLERSRKVVFWTGPEQRSMSVLDQLLVRFVKEEIHPFFSIAMR